MRPRKTCLSARLLVRVLMLLVVFVLAIPAGTGLAQETTPTAASDAEAPVETPTITTTPTITPTPTETPTPTPTFTALQARLVLAQTYLDGDDYAKAAEIFAEISLEDRGNAEALAGLNAALAGRASSTATAAAPPPTVVPAAPPPPEPGPTFGSTLAEKWREFAGVVLPALLLVLVVYLLANGVRWLLFGLRELFLNRVLPWFGRPAIPQGYLIGEFTDATGKQGFQGPQGPRVVAQALTDRLLTWNQLVQAKEVPVEPAPNLELGGMGWIEVLWKWILPPPRGYKITGTLLPGTTEAYELLVQRISLATNSIDRSHAFARSDATPEAAFRAMAREAAKWVISPQDIEASEATLRGMRAVRGTDEGLQLTASEIFDQALGLLLPVRQQINQGAIDYADARRRLDSVEAMLAHLPDGSPLRRDLADVITDLRRAVPGQ